MFASRFGQWVKGQSRGSRRQPSKGGPNRSYRPQVEMLETRCLLSTLRTLAYNEITALSTGVNYNNHLYPVLSADGSRAVFTNTTAGPLNHVFVINADGTGQQEVDSFDGIVEPVDISADGSKVISVKYDGSYHIRMVNADGTGLHEVITINSAYIQDRLSSDGSKVFFTAYGDFSLGTRGLYVVNADGTGLRQIVSGAQIGNLLGVPTDNIYVSSVGPSLAMTTDYSQIVFGVIQVAGQGAGHYLLGVNFDGGELHQILFAPNSVWHAGISGDGSKVFYDIVEPAGPNEAGVIKFDGSERHVLARSDSPGYPASDDPMQISADGSQLLMGTSSVLIDTTTEAKLQLAARGGWYSSDPPALLTDRMFRATMNSTATRFLYVAGDNNGVAQLATLDLNPDDLGAAPLLDNLSIDPSVIVADSGATRATVSATVSTPYTLIRVSNAVLKDGLDDYFGVTHQVMLDDGTGVFSNNQIYASSAAVPGERTVRVKAEVTDGAGLRHATAVEFDGLRVDPLPPPAPSHGGRGASTAGAAPMLVSETAHSAAPSGPLETMSHLQTFPMAQRGQEDWALLLASSAPDTPKAQDADAVWTAVAHDDGASMVDPLGPLVFDLAPAASLDGAK